VAKPSAFDWGIGDMSTGELQMALFSGLVLLMTLVGIGYIYIAQPESLRNDRDGVPYFTPEVENPATGQGVDMGTLIRHYRGETP
jgi:hypothetical protein